MTIRSISATQLLFIVEYASFNAQHSIGVGSAAKKDDGNNNMAEKTGTSLSLNDKSGTVQNNEKIQIVSYRGEENLWGNIWTMIDGVKYFSANAANSCGEIFIAKNAASAEDYDRIDIYPKIGKGYISAYGYSSDYDWLFIPTELNGNNLAPVGDWYRNQKDNWRGVLLGGSWNDGMSAGIFYWHFESNVNGNDRSIGVRLFYNGV